MRKKILYGILFVTLFLVSTTSMIQPVHAYEFGFPDEAVGVEGVAGQVQVGSHGPRLHASGEDPPLVEK